MKKVLFVALVATAFVIGGCTPTMKPRTLGAEEQEWADYLKEMYPGWKSPATLPQAVTLSSRDVPYTNIDLPEQSGSAVASDLPVFEDNVTVEVEQQSAVDSDKKVEAEVKSDSAEVKDEAQKEEAPLLEEQKVEFTEYVVEKNDSLSSIAKKVYGNGNKYLHIYKANEDVVKDPNKLYPGMKLKIPAIK